MFCVIMCYEIYFSLFFPLSVGFTFKEADKLTSRFLGIEYDAKWSTETQSLYTVIPGEPSFRFRYCSDEPLNKYAEKVAEDIRTYALPYFEKYDTLEKLEVYLEQNPVQGIGKDLNIQERYYGLFHSTKS